MTTFAGASQHPLLSNWISWCEDQASTWPAEAKTLAARAQWLANNDPFVAALVASHIQSIFAPTGARLTCLWDPDPGTTDTADTTRQVRRIVTAIAAKTWRGFNVDAENIRTRLDVEKALAWGAFVLGEYFAIRVVKNGRSRWRLVHPDRVANPGFTGNTDTQRDGFALVGGAVAGIWVWPGVYAGSAINTTGKPVFVPWIAEDGTPNVIHRVGLRLPGMIRGVSRLAPIVIMQRQVGGVLESHVAAKRLQAIIAMIVEAESPEEYAEAKTNGNAAGFADMSQLGPLNIWIKAPGTTTQFTDPKFNGTDLEAYLGICYKVQCATVQMPVDVVLANLGDSPLASARAGLDQYDRTGQTEQEAHFSQATNVIDQVAVADEIALGNLTAPAPVADLCVGKYSRPPKYSTDRLKDSNDLKTLLEAGVSRTTAFERYQMNWEDEVEHIVAELDFLKGQGINPDDLFLLNIRQPAKVTDPAQPGGTTSPDQTPIVPAPVPPAPGKAPTKAKAWWRSALSFLTPKAAA